jgi:tetratricopeptide (TPR) repeat protein
MPLRKLSAAEAFAHLKDNPFNGWPRADAPDNRFAFFADPAFTPRFRLEPGQRIFTIGSCFARNIEQALAARGFEIPTLEFTIDPHEWGGDPLTVLNAYVPAAIAPQIRWAFGLETFDLDRHGAEVRPGRFVDLQLTSGFRPVPAAVVTARRERIGAIYRRLAECHAVIITLGLIEAWFDHRGGGYINLSPPKSVAAADPGRFELHIQDYNEVVAEIRALVALLGRVCPADHRIILTVSPVPLGATFTKSDVAVANCYSKSVLRAAAEAAVSEFDHVEYFPSYESVTLSERALAFAEDQIHVTGPLVAFNVDRMIRRYVGGADLETPKDVIARALEERRARRPAAALKILQTAWAADPDNAELTVALAGALLQARSGKVAEKMLLARLAKGPDLAAHVLLATYYNGAGRHQEAAAQAEMAAEFGAHRMPTALQRVTAYYELGRYEEGLAVLDTVRFPLERRALILWWKARFNARLGQAETAEALFEQSNAITEDVRFMTAYAAFLGDQGRWDEAAGWVNRALVFAPSDRAALELRRELRGRSGVALVEPAGKRGPLRRLLRAARRAVGARARATEAPEFEADGVG